MATVKTWLRKKVLSLSTEEATFARRGFYARGDEAQARLERAGRTFILGYNLALDHEEPDALGEALATVARPWQGFAWEGAAMALTLLDELVPGSRDRLGAFLRGPGAGHTYMVHVGAGWALARLRRRVARPLQRRDPVLGWLLVDGYGFHEGYFHEPRYVRAQAQPRRLAGYALRAFDQGLGRSIWFIDGADVAQIVATVTAFSPVRQADLWGGVGLACAYAGGVEPEAVTALLRAAESFRPELAQGAAFAAKARQRAGNPAAHTEMACQILCGTDADEAAAVTDRALHDLPTSGSEPAYAAWRRRVQAYYAQVPVFAVPP